MNELYKSWVDDKRDFKDWPGRLIESVPLITTNKYSMNVSVLEIRFEFNGAENRIYPVVLQQDREMILVDCGYAGFLPLIEAAARQQGISLQQLTGVIITHHDIDHMGGLWEIKGKYPHIKVYASATDALYVSGQEKSLRLQQAEALYDSLPEEQKPSARYFQERLKSVRPVAVDATLTDGEEPAFLKGVNVIGTPGHMPGHISLYIAESKTLIAADAVVYEKGALNLANPAYTIDMDAAVASLKKLNGFAIDRLVCYHGGVVSGDVNGQLEQLIQKYSRH